MIAVLGASFKPGMDDAREFPAIWLAGKLGRRGAVEGPDSGASKVLLTPNASLPVDPTFRP